MAEEARQKELPQHGDWRANPFAKTEPMLQRSTKYTSLAAIQTQFCYESKAREVAADEILRANSEQRISGTARVA